MNVICKRELKSYFDRMLGWGIVAFLILAAGVISTVEHILGGSADFGYLFASLPVVLIPILPLLATVSCTADNTLGNTAWLYSLPVKRSAVILGKYFASLTVFLIPTAFLALLPPILALFGNVSYGKAYTALLGYALGGAAMLALCTLIASMMRRRVLAWLLGTLLCLLNYFLPILGTLVSLLPLIGMYLFAAVAIVLGVVFGIRRKKWLHALLIALLPTAGSVLLYLLLPQGFASLIDALSFFQSIHLFRSGHFELPTAVMLLCLCAFFLFLAIRHRTKPLCEEKSSLWQTLCSRRTRVLTGAVAILLAVNFVLPLLPFRMLYPDVSGSTTYQISASTQRYLAGITEPVEIIYNAEGGRRDADRDLYAFVLQFADANPKIKVSCRDITNYEGAEDGSITVRSQRRSRSFSQSDLFYYYSTSTGEKLSLEEYAQVIQQLSSSAGTDSYTSLMQLYGSGSISAYFCGDINLTSAIRYVLSDQAPTVYTYATESAGSISALLRQQLEQCGYSVTELENVRNIPADCELLYLSVVKDIGKTESESLSAYLAGGGGLLLTTSYLDPDRPNLASVLSTYGLSEPTEQNLIYTVSDSQTTPMFSAVAGDHPACDALTGSVVGLYAHAINITEKEGVTQIPLLKSPASSYLIQESTSDEPTAASYTVGVAAEMGESRVTWISMTIDSLSDGLSTGINFDLVEALVGDMTGVALTPLSIPNAALPSSLLSTTTGALIAWVLLFVILIPGALLAVGGLRKYARRRMG